MKKDNFKKAAPKATTPRPSLLRRGMGRSMRGMGRFGVSKKENGLWLYGIAARIVKGFRQTALPYDDTVKRYEPRKRKPNNDNFGFGAWNFKHWHKLSAAFVSIAIIGIVVFFQDA